MAAEEIGSLPAVDEVHVKVVQDPTWTPARMSEGACEKLRLPLQKLEPLRPLATYPSPPRPQSPRPRNFAQSHQHVGAERYRV